MGDIYEKKEYPEKSWSISKMKTLDNCYREYYYTYYGSHNGWIWNAPDECKAAWRLKKLTNIWLMFGDKLHDVIKRIIKSGNSKVDIDRVKSFMKTQLNIGVKNSLIKFKDGSWDEYPKGEMLQEYYYGEKLQEKEITEIKERIELCIDNFFKSKTYREVLEPSSTILEVDEGKFDYIFIHGVKVFALIDALYIDDEGNCIIVDWKTGKIAEHDKEQLLVYALYVMEKYNVPLNKIRGRIEYLLSGENVEYIFTEKEINEIYKRIQNELKVINAFLVDKDLNIPRDKDDFSKCDNLNICNKCKFKKLCLDDMEVV